MLNKTGKRILLFVISFLLVFLILFIVLFNAYSGYSGVHKYCLKKEHGADLESRVECLVKHFPEYFKDESEYCYANRVMTDYDYSLDLLYYIDHYENIAYVSFDKLKHNIAHEKRGEYVFDVKGWIKGGNGENKLKIYSEKEPGMFHSWYECYGYAFEENADYIIFLKDNDDGSYELTESKIWLDGIKQNNYEYPVFYYHGEMYDATHFGAASKDVTKEEFVELVKAYADSI